ncbi:sterol o-acyltransferase [Pyrenophora seminiperda CCB06]|uniref:Sterol o-acyltransferase n=1 Tax=Pyrenophora seminiperda CCB06 TaxID=1302712 RepID=A0A3M7LWD7_9PLEO|nr:sterol o-acyltransferase [Pyrenophora seminiperda CCB06]
MQLTLCSGRSTPIPPDAPPSVQASSLARRQIRAQQKQRMFPTIDYVGRVSHFDPDSDYHDFRGFFVLFWIGLAIMVITSMLRNLTETGYPLQIRQWALFKEKIVELGLVDFAMAFSTALCLPIQKLFLKEGSFRWHTSGMAIQSVLQAIWLAFWTTYATAGNVVDCRLTMAKIPIYSRLELDSSGLLHSAFACNLHENALIRVCCSKALVVRVGS